MISENSYSIKSSLLNDEMLAQRRKKERYALAVGVFAQFVWAINSIQLKTYKSWFPKAFSYSSLAFWRSVPIWFLGYAICKYKKIEIKPVSQVKYKFWFWLRSAGNYFGIVLWVLMMTYFRVSTCQCIAGCYPVLILFLSVWILHETFYVRYLAGVFFCLLGTSIIVLNERTPTKSEEAQEAQDKNILVGCLISMTHLTFLSLSNFGQKIICKEHMCADVQNYFMGKYNALPALLFMIIEWHFGISDILYVLFAMTNGFVFYIGNYYTAIALDNISISKYVPITYTLTVFVFLLGFLFLGEKVYFTDVIGSLMILGFQLYNVWVPIKKK